MLVFTGVSGGVDSAAALKILKDAGYDVVAVYVFIHDSDTSRVARICKQIGVDLLVVDMRSNFEQKIRKYFVSQYLSGITPNPCALCNRFIKFAAIYAEAKRHSDSAFIATGHYARIRHSDDGSIDLRQGVDVNKDQTYFLALLPKKILLSTLFPLGDLTKRDVREIIAHYKIDAESRESQDVCFLKGTTVAKFIEENANVSNLTSDGKIVTRDGDIVGIHSGFFRYTIGQRKGLNLGGMDNRMYVVGIDPIKNEIIVGEHDDLYVHRVVASSLNWIDSPPIVGDMVKIKTRYRQTPIDAEIIYISSDTIKVKTVQPVWAPTPGQVLAVYDNNRLLGGGIIEQR